MTPIGFLAFGALAVQLAVVALLLLPFVNRLTAPLVENALAKFRTPFIVFFFLLILGLLNSAYNMRHLQDESSEAKGTLDRSSTLIQKFREERNFYLYCFSTTLSLIILRIGPMLNEYRRLKNADQLKKAN